jgi:hypothetical protein
MRTCVADNEDLEAVVAHGSLSHGDVVLVEVLLQLQRADVVVAVRLLVHAAKHEHFVAHRRHRAVNTQQGGNKHHHRYTCSKVVRKYLLAIGVGKCASTALITVVEYEVKSISTISFK